MRFLFLPCIICVCLACNQTNYQKNGGDSTALSNYFNYGDTGLQTAGIKLIPIQTPVGKFKVWTKRFGNNPNIKILLLHGS